MMNLIALTSLAFYFPISLFFSSPASLIAHFFSSTKTHRRPQITSIYHFSRLRIFTTFSHTSGATIDNRQ